MKKIVFLCKPFLIIIYFTCQIYFIRSHHNIDCIIRLKINHQELQLELLKIFISSSSPGNILSQPDCFED